MVLLNPAELKLVHDTMAKPEADHNSRWRQRWSTTQRREGKLVYNLKGLKYSIALRLTVKVVCSLKTSGRCIPQP